MIDFVQCCIMMVDIQVCFNDVISYFVIDVMLVIVCE